MWSKIIGCLIPFLLIWSSSGHAASLTTEQQQAKERGIALFNQYRESGPDLRIAAEAGDAESQFYLAEELRQLNRFITPEAQQWLEAAAAQGYIYAMIRLARSGGNLCAVVGNCPEGNRTPNEWLQYAHEVALPLAEQGDPEAMLQMYRISSDTKWLVNAAEAGHAEAQYLQAISIRKGSGFYWWPGDREKDAERWFEVSALNGHPLSMMRHAAVLIVEGDNAGYRYWLEKAAATGYASAVFGLGIYSAHEPEKADIELDLVKGYALVTMLLELDGGGSIKSSAESVLPSIEIKMTPEQVEQALEFAEEWKSTHPPLSFFPQMLNSMDN